MKALFVHDHRFQVNDEGDVFSSGSFPSVVWGRYLDFFDKLIVVARTERLDPKYGKLVASQRDGVSFCFVDNPASIKSRLEYGRAIKSTLNHQIREADAVIVRLPSQLGFIAISILRKMNKPYLVEVVGCPRDAYWFHGSILGKLYSPIAMWQQKKAVRSARLVIYVSKQFLPQRYPTNGELAFASNVELPALDCKLTPNRLSRISSIESGGIPTFGTIGSLASKYKGIDTVFEVMSKVSVPFVYRILGPGNTAYWEGLARKYGIADRVFFDGVLPAGDAVLEWLEGIDIYLQPSLTEGLPRAVIEALSSGCMAIGSDVGGMGELIPSRFMHKPKDVGRLATIIDSVLKEPSQIMQQSERGLAVAKRYESRSLTTERARVIGKLREFARAQSNAVQVA